MQMNQCTFGHKHLNQLHYSPQNKKVMLSQVSVCLEGGLCPGRLSVSVEVVKFEHKNAFQ